MKTYATYFFYTDTYGGTAAEVEFNRNAYKASRFIDKITFDRHCYGSGYPGAARLRCL